MSSPRRKRRAAPRPQSYTFNPGSFDAQFASIHAALDTQNKLRDVRMDQQDELLKEIKEQTMATNGRVTVLENAHKWSKGWIAGAAAVFSLIGSGIWFAAFRLMPLFH